MTLSQQACFQNILFFKSSYLGPDAFKKGLNPFSPAYCHIASYWNAKTIDREKKIWVDKLSDKPLSHEYLYQLG